MTLSIDHYVALHRAQCAVLDCEPERSVWFAVFSTFATPLAVGATLALFMATGLSRRLSSWLEARSWRGIQKDGLYGAALGALTWLTCLPVSYWQRFANEGDVRAMFRGPLPESMTLPSPAQQRWGWLGNQLEWLVPAMAVGAIVAVLSLALLQRMPRSFWLVPALAFIAWLAGLSVRDDYRDLRPVPDTPLGAEIAEIARVAGVATDRVMVGEGWHGRPVAPDTAYVTWHGGRQVAVIGAPYFNVLTLGPHAYRPRYEPVTAAEVRAVAAHEIAHLKHGHTALLIFGMGLAALLAAWLVSFALRRSSVNVACLTALPTVVLFFGMAFLVLHPLRMAVSRFQEGQADATGLDIGREPAGFADLALRLARGRPIDLPVVTHVLLYTHPDPLERIERAVAWAHDNEARDWQATGLSGPVRQCDDCDPIDWPPAAEPADAIR